MRAVGAVETAYNIEDQQRMTRAKNYFAWQAQLIKPELGQRVVEIGCGIGNFTGELLDRELVIAVDSDPEVVTLLRERHPSVNAITRDVGRETLSDLAGFRPDSCVFSNVLEHIANDRAAIRDAAEILLPGASIVILTPAFPALFGPIDRNLGHERRYTRAAIKALADSAGLSVARFQYLNVVGFFGWWANAHIFKRTQQSDSQIEVFDRYIVPVMRSLENTISPPFGQSIFAVLRKPETIS